MSIFRDRWTTCIQYSLESFSVCIWKHNRKLTRAQRDVYGQTRLLFERPSLASSTWHFWDYAYVLHLGDNAPS